VVDRAGRRTPLQGFAVPQRAWAVVAAVQATLSGFLRLSEFHSVRRSGVSGPPPPPRRDDRPRGVPSSGLLLDPKVRSDSRRLESLSGHSSAFRAPASRPRPSPPGVLLPFDDVSGRVRTLPGVASPARSVLEVSHLLDGFSPRFALRPRGPLPSMGFLRRSETSLSAEPRCVAAPLAIHCRRVSPPFALRRKERDTTTPDRSKPNALARVSLRHPCLGPGASPLRSTSSRPAAATGVAAIPLPRFLPRPSSVKWMASGRRPRVCTVRNLRICWRPAAPLGLSCTDETRTGASRCVHPRSAGAPRGAGGCPCP